MYVRIKGNKTIYRLIGYAYNAKPILPARRGKAVLLDLTTVELVYSDKDRLEPCTDRPEQIQPKEFN